jgi:hypothetical protein
VKEQIELGANHVIRLWLFGFLYYTDSGTEMPNTAKQNQCNPKHKEIEKIE